LKDAAAIYDENVQITKGTNIDISGLNYEMLQTKKTVQWPFNNKNSGYRNEALIYRQNILHADQRAIIHSVPDDITSEKPCPNFPFVLTTGRIRDSMAYDEP
jgi:ferredoxin-nitrate reductase